MIPIAPAAIPVVAVLAAWYLTGRMRRYALARRLLDVPNVRSSHSAATPRGGGVAIVLTTLVAFLMAGFLHFLPWPTVFGLAGGGILVAGIGFMDDRHHVARRWRLLAHVGAATWVLWFLGGLPPLATVGAVFDLGWTGHALAVLYLVWLVNLTNFMDGIDGIAAIETITVCVGAVCIYLLTPGAGDLSLAPSVLAAACLGFLVWNWPPAKIFMGDAGSGFIGLILGGLSLQAAWTAPTLLWGWVILLGVFVVDATTTLIHRGFRGARLYDAHRTHAYQHAAQRWGTHAPVTMTVAAINIVWLFPCAVLVARHVLDGPTGVLIAYAPLLAVAVGLGAGRPRPSDSRDPSLHV